MSHNDLQESNYDEEEIKEEPISEETDEEIIDNDCIDEDEEEFIDQEEKISSEKEEEEIINKNQQKSNKNLSNIKEEKNEMEHQIKNKRNKKLKKNNDIKNIQLNQNQNNSQKNRFKSYYSPKFDFARKKHKKVEEKKPDDLFIQAIEKNKIKNETRIEYVQDGNTLSTKVADIVYDKYIGQNGRKVNTIDVISRMRDEEVRVNREALRTKEDAKKINDMINRQEDFEKLKINKLKEKEKEINDKISQECVFMPNGIITASRTPEDFYNSQLKFIERKENNIDQIYKNILENENKNMNKNLTSKTSEKIASAKNPNESREDFLKRLHYEKLKNVKENLEKPKKEKKLTKEQVNDLSNKLYKEGQTFRENKTKKQREKLLNDMNSFKEEVTSEKSNKVLLDKFISYYDKILLELFNRNNNFEIGFDEYKLILSNMGCINPNSPLDEQLINESFNKYLKPKGDKIDTYSFLVFGLAALGIYKGNDEIKQQKITSNINTDHQRNINQLRNNKSKSKLKTSSELIKTAIPNLDLNKYGYTNKITKIIKQKYLPFVKGLNNSWIGDNSKKKQERREKFEEFQKNEEMKRINKDKKIVRKDYKDYNSYENNIENRIDNNNINDNIKNICKTNKLEDVYRIIQQKKEKDLKTLKAKKEAEELALCTFQPKINKSNNNNKNNLNRKQINKNFEKLYQEGKAAYIQKKKLIEHDPEDNEENKINCTFKPSINPFNNEIFTKNPLKKDMEKFEKIREKKMNNSHKGFERPMNFCIESKINKEDIIDRVIPDRNTYRNDTIYEEKSKEEMTPLLKVEVNLDEKNNTDKIIIYPGDNIKEKTIQFCVKHKLSEEKKNTLLNIIMEKMKESNENENEDIYQNKNDKNKSEKKNSGEINIKNNLNNVESKNEEEMGIDDEQLFEDIEENDNKNES